MKNYKISLAGDIGSGKSTVGQILSKKYNLEKVSIGLMLRDMANEYGMDVNEFNSYMETHTEIDGILDGKLKEFETKDGNYLFDSRMAWHFVPSSFSVYISVSPEIAAKRIMKAKRSTEIYKTLEEAIEGIKARRKSEVLRYSKLYSVDVTDLKNYNLVVDTDDKTPEEIAKIISLEFENWLKK